MARLLNYALKYQQYLFIPPDILGYPLVLRLDGCPPATFNRCPFNLFPT
jgi:hypothetical protein